VACTLKIITAFEYLAGLLGNSADERRLPTILSMFIALTMPSQARLHLLPLISLGCCPEKNTGQGAMEEELVRNKVTLHFINYTK
jgi:hypothetical protein